MGRQKDAGLILTLESTNDSLRLDPWLQNQYGDGVQALTGVAGFGFPLVENQWFEGVGDGAVYQGTRHLARVIRLPLHFEGPDRLRLGYYLTRISRIFNEGARLVVQEPEGNRWILPVYRETGGDYRLGGQQTDQRKWLRPDEFVMRSENAFWTRETPETIIVRSGSGRGLLPRLGALRVSSSQALGTRTVINPGDATSYGLWHIDGPGSEFVATSSLGEVLAWTGTLAEDEWVEIDTINGLVYDNLGDNRYGELGEAPVMWAFQPGSTVVDIQLNDTSSVSQIVCKWKPQRKTMI